MIWCESLIKVNTYADFKTSIQLWKWKINPIGRQAESWIQNTPQVGHTPKQKWSKEVVSNYMHM